jgi:hypothetical protein
MRCLREMLLAPWQVSLVVHLRERGGFAELQMSRRVFTCVRVGYTVVSRVSGATSRRSGYIAKTADFFREGREARHWPNAFNGGSATESLGREAPYASIATVLPVVFL